MASSKKQDFITSTSERNYIDVNQLFPCITFQHVEFYDITTLNLNVTEKSNPLS